MRSPELGCLPPNSTGIGGFFFWILFNENTGQNWWVPGPVWCSKCQGLIQWHPPDSGSRFSGNKEPFSSESRGDLDNQWTGWMEASRIRILVADTTMSTRAVVCSNLLASAMVGAKMWEKKCYLPTPMCDKCFCITETKKLSSCHTLKFAQLIFFAHFYILNFVCLIQENL